jgi:hypothetical protein
LFSFVSSLCIFEYLANVLGVLNCSIVDSIYCFFSFSYFSWFSSGDEGVSDKFFCWLSTFYFLFDAYTLYWATGSFLPKNILVITDLIQQKRTIQTSYIWIKTQSISLPL